ncbi:MAG: glycerol-3-phosphate acyltransferase [Chloroflexota bacterium]
MEIVFWSLVSFLSGSLPFSVWVGRLVLRKDIRDYGDGNPGMTNVLRAGGKAWGIVAMLLDGFKGAIPVGLARWVVGIEGWEMIPVALAPVLGHAFSPFLKFRGGKAVAVTFGVWTGLTFWQAPNLLGVSLALGLAITAADAWPVLVAMLALLAYLLRGAVPDWMLAMWAGNLVILLWKHRHELRRPPRLRPWLRRLFRLP